METPNAPDDFTSVSLDTSSRASPVRPLTLWLLLRACTGRLNGWGMAGRKEQDQDKRRRAGSRTRAPPARARGFGACSRVPPVLASVRKRLHCRKRAHGVGAGRAAGGPDGAWRSVSRVRGAGPQKMGRGARVVRPGRHAGSVRRAGEEHYAVSRDCGMTPFRKRVGVGPDAAQQRCRHWALGCPTHARRHSQVY